MSIHPDDTLILSIADSIRKNLARIEEAARTGERGELANCKGEVSDLEIRTTRLAAIVRRYQNG